MKPDRKKFKETKVGAWLKKHFPDVLSVASDLTGIEALDKVGELIKGSQIKPEQLAEFKELEHQQRIEVYQLQLQDIQSARNREAEVAKATGRIDIFQRVVGTVGLILLIMVVCYALFADIKNSIEFAHVKGLVEGIALSIFTYFFGSSAKVPK